MAYRINPEECIGCGSCETLCPQKCIFKKEDQKFAINEEKCIECGSCRNICPVDAPEIVD